MTGTSYKNIKSEKSNFSEAEIEQAIDVINKFSGVLEASKIIMSSLLIKQANSVINLDEESQELLVEWARDFALLRENLKNLNEGTKPH